MTFTHGLSTNNYGPYKFIVATSPANGTHTTLASAMAAAVSGDTIYMRNSVIENVAVTAGVSIIGPGSESVKIEGTLSFTGIGSSLISGLSLVTNGAPFVTIAGVVGTEVTIDNCFLHALNANGITYSTASATAILNITNCNGDIGGAFNFWNMTSTGTMHVTNCDFKNSANSTVANSSSSGTILVRGVTLENGISNTGTAQIFIQDLFIQNGATNQVCLVLNGGVGQVVFNSFLNAGNADCIQCNTDCVLIQCFIDSSSAGAVTGAGTLFYSNLTFGSTTTITMPVQSPQNWQQYATYSTPGTSFFSSSDFTVTNGFVSLIGPIAFTPQLAFGGASVGITYTTQLGTYTLSNGVCTFAATIVLSSKGVSIGTATMSLPVTSGAGINYSLGNASFPNLLSTPVGTNVVIAQLLPASNTCTFECLDNQSISIFALDNGSFNNTTEIRVSGSYFV